MKLKDFIDTLTKENVYGTCITSNQVIFKLNTPSQNITRFIWALVKLEIKEGTSLEVADSKFQKLLEKAQNRITMRGGGYNKVEHALQIALLHLSYIKGYENLRNFDYKLTQYFD